MKHHIKLTKLITIAVFLIALVAAVPAGLVHASTGLTRVSGPSPYASCVNAGEPGTNYVNAEVEPDVAVNPTNPNNIIGAWQQGAT